MAKSTYISLHPRAKAFLTLLCFSVLLMGSSLAQNVDLNQYANGKIASVGAAAGPGAWQNGNLNPNNCHLAESYSVPYRAPITGLTPGATYVLRIGIDVKESGSIALDYFTGYQNLTPHDMFAHAPEAVNPLLGIAGSSGWARNDYPLPAPAYASTPTVGQPTNSFNALKTLNDGINGEADKGEISLFNATVANPATDIFYDYALAPVDLNAASTVEAILAIKFTATGSSVVIAWGGHIADQDDWGALATPANINGSPYHCRIKNLRDASGNILAQGSTDRSLKASAVFRPPTCTVSAAQTKCEGDANFVFNYTGGSTDITSFTWSLSGAYTGKYKIQGAAPDGTLSGNGVPTSVTIIPVNTTGGLQPGSFTINLSVTNPCCTTTCSSSGTVNPDPTADAGTDPASQCFDASDNVNRFTVSGTATNGTILWTVKSKPATMTVNILSPNSASTNVDITGTAAGGTVILTMTVTSNQTPSCGTDADDVDLVVNPLPDINNPAIGAICAGTTTASVSYSGVTNGANQYKIDWDNTANTAGLVDIVYTNLLASPFNITVPATLAVGTYNGTIYVKNTTTGCESTGDAISLTVNPLPNADAGTDPAAQCFDASDNVNRFTVSGTATNGTILWTVKSKPATMTVNILSPTSASTNVDVTGTAAGGTVILTMTVTSNQTPSCGTDADDVELVVLAQPVAPNTTYLPPACNETHFKVQVDAPVISGATYKLYNGTTNALVQTVVAADTDPFTFSTGIAAGAGYKVTVTLTSGCTSAPDVCPEPSGTTRVSGPTEEVQTIDARIISDGKTKVLAAPNPFTDRVRFTLQSEVSGQGSLELYNMMGQKVATVYQGHVEAGKVLSKEFAVQRVMRGNLIYVFRVGDQKVTGKLLNW